MNKKLISLLIVAIACLCVSSTSAVNSTSGPRLVRFEFRFVRGGPNDRVVAATNNKNIISAARAQLALPLNQRNMFIHGRIARGDGRHNQPWSWHFVPNQWGLTRAAIEVCDGTPRGVEADLNYWVDYLGYFCPWSSYVYAELPSTMEYR